MFRARIARSTWLLSVVPALALAVTPASGQMTAPNDLTPQQLEALWADLALAREADVPDAMRAMRLLARSPAQSVRLLGARLRSAPDPDPCRMAALLEALGAEHFRARLQAENELRELGQAARRPLEQTLARRPSLDVSRRIERLLQELDTAALSSEELRALRSVEVLGMIGSAEARVLLGRLAQGAAGMRVTEAARRCLADKKEVKDEDGIQGNWSVVALEIGGVKEPREMVQKMKVTIKDRKITINDGERSQSLFLSLDPSKSPRWIDFFTPSDDDDDFGALSDIGIYELDGDTLKLCWTKGKETRPTEFASKPKSDTWLVVLQRGKK